MNRKQYSVLERTTILEKLLEATLQDKNNLIKATEDLSKKVSLLEAQLKLANNRNNNEPNASLVPYSSD